jgi:hypothetical protein
MELVRRATAIKKSLEFHLMRLETDPAALSKPEDNLFDVFTSFHGQPSALAMQSSLVTKVWVHAAYLYLYVVVSGWQPANVEVCYHVRRIVELLSHEISPPTLLRTMSWPLCVAGCLALVDQEAQFSQMVEALQPPSVFGTVHKALEIMKNVWRSRDAADTANRDVSACLRYEGDLVLLV